MATDPIMIAAAFTGLVVALLLRGILPYLQKRKEAEETGQPIPSFANSYLTTFIISIITGVMGIMVTANELELKLVGVTSIMTAVAIGFSFSYSSLSLTNTIVDLSTKKIEAQKEISILSKQQSPPSTTEEESESVTTTTQTQQPEQIKTSS